MTATPLSKEELSGIVGYLPGHAKWAATIKHEWYYLIIQRLLATIASLQSELAALKQPVGKVMWKRAYKLVETNLPKPMKWKNGCRAGLVNAIASEFSKVRQESAGESR